MLKITKNGMKFINLSYVPIDKNLIIKRMLNNKEKFWLNQYHKNVHKNLKNI